jgi:hypothetical protein
MVPRTVLRTGALPDWPTGPLVAEVIRTIAELGGRRILLRALREGIDNRYTHRASVAEALIEAARRKAAAAVRAEAREMAADEDDRAGKSK